MGTLNTNPTYPVTIATQADRRSIGINNMQASPGGLVLRKATALIGMIEKCLLMATAADENSLKA